MTGVDEGEENLHLLSIAPPGVRVEMQRIYISAMSPELTASLMGATVVTSGGSENFCSGER